MRLRKTSWLRLLWPAATLALRSVLAFGSPAAGAQNAPGFTAEIAPLLQRHCVACHSPEQAKGHFHLDTFEALLTPGSSGRSTIVPGQPQESHLYQLLIETDPNDRMPQKAEALPPSEIATIRSWIASGAKFDGPNPSVPLTSLLPKAQRALAPEHYGRPCPVTALAFDPRGTGLVAGGYHEITFWDPGSGVLLRRVGGMPERIRGLAWQPGGKLLAVAGGAPGRSGEILLVDARFAPIEIGTGGDEMLCAAFSPDGQRLGVGGADNSIRIFDVKSRRQVMRLDQHSDWVHALTFSADGRWLASASRDRTARVYNSTNGEVSAIFRDHEAAVEGVVFAGDGKSILSAGADRRLRICRSSDAGEAKEFAKFDIDITALTPGSHSVFAGLADGRVIERGLPGGESLGEYAGSSDRVTALAWLAEPQWLAIGSYDGTVRIWDLQEGVLLLQFTASPGFERLARN